MKINSTAIAIFIGFGLVAGAIFVSSNNSGGTSANGVTMNGGHGAAQAATTDSSPKREQNRHIYGSVDAPVTIVEFSDFECPFCARLHPTLGRLVDESDGQVAWEYRHLPLPSHRNAEMAAAIGECVASNLGNEAFWDYGSTVFGNQRSVNTTFLTETAGELGLAQEDLQTCINTSEVQSQIRTDLNTARSFGGNGTPFSVVVFADGTTRPVSGALPYESWKQLLSL